MTSPISTSKVSEEISQKLKQIYHSAKDPGSYGGRERFFKSVKSHGLKVTRNQVNEFLKGFDTYTLHKPSRKHFSRNPTIVSDIDQQWQADLADVSEFASDNDDTRYLLTIVDCFSKFAWVIPLKTKDSNRLFVVFTQLFHSRPIRRPKRIQTDKGKEFINSQVQNLFTKFGIHHFVTQNETKASMVERFNRTLKSRLWAYMTGNNTDRYIDALDDIVDSYNHSVHRTIGMRPADVKPKDVGKIFHRVYGKYFATQGESAKIPIGETVRLSNVKTIFAKGYRPSWTREMFHVTAAHPHAKKAVYKLEDFEGDEIAGSFYPEEIQSIKAPDENSEYLVERTLKKRKAHDGSTEYFVKWQGWPEKFNSWVTEEQYGKSK